MKIIIPTELKDIKLSDYLRYKKVVEDNPNDEVFCAISMVSKDVFVFFFELFPLCSDFFKCYHLDLNLVVQYLTYLLQ